MGSPAKSQRREPVLGGEERTERVLKYFEWAVTGVFPEVQEYNCLGRKDKKRSVTLP